MEEISTLLNNMSSFENEYLEKVKKIIKDNKNHHQKLESIKQQYVIDKKNFNIFTIFSDFYYRENFQSDILKIILDPNTVEIGNKVFLNQFYDFLKNIIEQTPSYKNNDVDFPDVSNAKVIREEHNIDLLIHDDKNAIIIESKLNNAVDQPDQLARYYEYVTTEKNLKVQCVLYLVPEGDKRPNFQSYSKEYQSYVDKIKNILLIIPALSPSKLDLISYLENCINRANSDLTNVFIKQFIGLLRKNCGGLKTMEVEKKILTQLCSTEENIKITQDIYDVWNKRRELIKSIILEKVLEDAELNFRIWPSHNKVGYKKLNENIIIGLGIDDGLYFGFTYDPKIENDPEIEKHVPESQITKYKTILSNNCFTNNTKGVERDKKWVYRYYIIREDELKTIDFYFNDIKEKLLNLERLALAPRE